MKAMLLGLVASAAVVLPAVPAQAERWSDTNFVAAANVTVHRGNHNRHFGRTGPEWQRPGQESSRHHGRPPHHGGDDGFDRPDRHDRDDDFADGGWWYYPQDFDGNRSFDPDKFNDWWHERTSRSYPRWVQNNQNCERQYYTGAGWRC